MNEFNTTFKIGKYRIFMLILVRDLELSYSKPSNIVKGNQGPNLTSFKNLYNYKVKEMEENQDEADKIEREYHLGVMDPARIVAKIEKQIAIKKNVGKKQKVNTMLKKNAEKNEN